MKKSGFTLIELLVVIAIVAILISIIIPVASKGIEMARRAQCAANMKAVGTACLAYAADHKGWLPYGNDTPPSSPFSESTRTLVPQAEKLYEGGYLTDLRAWVCPSDRIDYSDTPISVARDIDSFNSIGNCSYMYISGYSVISTPENPALAPLLCDESNDREFGPANAGNMPKITREDNHGANVRNVFFLDGHLITYKDADASNAIFDNLQDTDRLCSVD